jgi:flagellar hook-basal body complex protein FliE
MLMPITTLPTMGSQAASLGGQLLQSQSRFSIAEAPFSSFITGATGAQPISAMGGTNGAENVNALLKNTLGQVNQTVQAPDALMQQLMRGGNVDIHDVAMANTKAELAVTLTSQMLTKMVQAYERVSQIQV